jgi:hypothetical protein
MSPPSQIGGRGQGGVAAAIGGGGEAQRPGGWCDAVASPAGCLPAVVAPSS